VKQPAKAGSPDEPSSLLASTGTSLSLDPRPDHWLQRAVSFTHEGKQLVGVIVAQQYVGRNPRGDLDDWLVTVRGQSGKTVEVSFLDAYVALKE
jgi:hypothetical protein